MIIVYIAGPIKGMPGENKQAFAEATAAIRQLGYQVNNPHEFCADIPLGSDDTVYYRRGLVELATNCTDILMLPGWKFSTGANMEYQASQVMGIRIHESVEDFKRYILHRREKEAEANG